MELPVPDPNAPPVHQPPSKFLGDAPGLHPNMLLPVPGLRPREEQLQRPQDEHFQRILTHAQPAQVAPSPVAEIHAVYCTCCQALQYSHEWGGRGVGEGPSAPA